MPVRMDGTEGPAAESVRKFLEELKAVAETEVMTWDERLTRAQAQKLMISADVSRKGRKGAVDGMAAAIMLQSFLDSRSETIDIGWQTKYFVRYVINSKGGGGCQAGADEGSYYGPCPRKAISISSAAAVRARRQPVRDHVLDVRCEMGALEKEEEGHTCDDACTCGHDEALRDEECDVDRGVRKAHIAVLKVVTGVDGGGRSGPDRGRGQGT